MASGREQRRFERFKDRVSCTFKLGETIHRGFATDLSAGGLFLQTRSKPDPDTKLVVNLDREGETPLAVTGAVIRLRRSHPGAVSVRQPGVGFAIDSAPEDYFQLIMKLGAGR